MDRLTRILTSAACAFGAVLAIACGNDITAPPVPESLEPFTVAPAAELRCEPQPRAAASARIGPSGGTLRTGRHLLRIPAGALKNTVAITMVSPSDTLNYVVFGPEGLTFDTALPPILTMSYRHCPGAIRYPGPLEIVYVDDALTNVLETTQLVSADTLSQTVNAELRHFSTYLLKKSRYAVAY